jgi:YihY family inner membrane protein
MNTIQKLIGNIDSYQRSHRLPGFIFAVIKKYGDDEAGYQSALLTYYGFLSLFPLLLVLSTVVGLIAGSHSALQHTIIQGVTNYFPTLGDQLSAHVSGIHKTGVALATGILFTFYGARGVADAFRHGVNHIWRTPRADRDGFPKSVVKSLSLVVIGGTGLVGASLIASFAANAGHGIGFHIASILIDMFILFWLFIFLLNTSLPKHVQLKEIRSGALSAAIGLVVLQAVGSYLLKRELRNLDNLYSNFAVVLGLLFWIYLQAQMIYYSIEIASVKSAKLWPRSLSGKQLTAADKRALASLADKEQVIPAETIKTTV